MTPKLSGLRQPFYFARDLAGQKFWEGLAGLFSLGSHVLAVRCGWGWQFSSSPGLDTKMPHSHLIAGTWCCQLGSQLHCHPGHPWLAS